MDIPRIAHGTAMAELDGEMAIIPTEDLVVFTLSGVREPKLKIYVTGPDSIEIYSTDGPIELKPRAMNVVTVKIGERD